VDLGFLLSYKVRMGDIQNLGIYDLSVIWGFGDLGNVLISINFIFAFSKNSLNKVSESCPA